MTEFSHAEVIASVVCAAFAFLSFVGIVITSVMSWKVAKRQMRVQLQVATQQIIAPMRQAWINKLRERITTFKSMSLEWMRLDGLKQLTKFDCEKMIEVYEEIKLLLHRGEPDHDQLVQIMETMLHALTDQRIINDEQLTIAGKTLTDTAQKILKTEWEVTKRMECDHPDISNGRMV